MKTIIEVSETSILNFIIVLECRIQLEIRENFVNIVHFQAVSTLSGYQCDSMLYDCALMSVNKNLFYFKCDIISFLSVSRHFS